MLGTPLPHGMHSECQLKRPAKTAPHAHCIADSSDNVQVHDSLVVLVIVYARMVTFIRDGKYAQ
jgi:hypothetical protein